MKRPRYCPAFLLFLLTAQSCFWPTNSLRAQSEGGTIIAIGAQQNAQDTTKPRFDFRVKRTILRYQSEVSFLLPEGEFDASFEKKIGYFSSLIGARYNFLRGEMGFRLQNLYTRYRVVPQLLVFDKLTFVPLFDKNRIWRREQGMQIGARVLFAVPINTYTSFNYVRYTFPSNINTQQLDSQEVRSITQSIAGEADSVRFLGLTHTGIFEVQLERAFPLVTSSLNFLQLQLTSRGRTEHRYFALEGEFRWITLLGGTEAPRRFLGGRNRLSAFSTNVFSGVDLLYLSAKTQVHLRKTHLQVGWRWGLYEIDWGVHSELGQVGKDGQMRDFSSYHTSLGTGIDLLTSFRREPAFALSFYTYFGLERGRNIKYYLGFKL